MASLDELLPVKKHLAPSWGDSVSIRGMRAYISTHNYFTGSASHHAEVTLKMHGHPNCRICVYLPPEDKHDENRGVLVHFHGGGWSICTPEMESRYCHYMADALGCIVLAPDYAKAPEHYFPHALRQAYGLMEYISRPVHAEEESLAKALNEKLPAAKYRLGFDRTRIALTGGSSGGNIATALTLLTHRLPLQEKAKIVSLGLQYPGLNLATLYEHKKAKVTDQTQIVPPPWASRLFLRCFLPTPYGTEEARSNPFVSPGLADDQDLKAFPPVEIVTGEFDHYRAESEDFAKRMEELGRPCDITVIPGVAHAFDTAPMGDEDRKARNEEATKQSWTLLADHLRKYL